MVQTSSLEFVFGVCPGVRHGGDVMAVSKPSLPGQGSCTLALFQEFQGQLFFSISLIGVLFMAPRIIRRPMFCTLSSLFLFVVEAVFQVVEA